MVHQGTAKQATYVNQRFDLGYFGDESALDANFYVVGRYYYNFTKYTPRVVAYITGNSGPKHWVDADAADLVTEITGDVGHFASDEEATPHVNAVGNVYYNERSRVYRRVATFRAGSGPVLRPQRLRQANEDDLARIDAEFRDSVELILQASPAEIDIGNRPDQFRCTLSSRPRHYNGATKVRFRFLEADGDAPDDPTFIEFPYINTTSRQDFHVVLSQLQQARLATYGPNGSIPLICEIRTADDDILGQAYVSILTVPSLHVRGRTVVDAVSDLEDRAADLRIVLPQGWETAIGTGVGISLTTAIVADPSTLSYQKTVTIPVDETANDPLLIYMAIPTGSNLSDWRVDLDGFAQYTGISFGEVATSGSLTIYVFTTAVGDGSGGFASGTAPGATLTLQHHGTTPHTAYSGDLEGRALAQIQSSRSQNIQPAVDGGDTAGVAQITLPADYATYRTLSVTLWRTSVDRIDPLEIATEFLSAQASNRSIYTDDAVIGWNPTTRVLSTPNQRIIYAELHDGTGSGTSSGGSTFSPTKTNLYQAVKAIFHPATNAGVTADDSNSELDVAGGGGSSYTLPAASSTTRGGVRGITQAIVDAATSTEIFGWSIANVYRAIRSQVSQWARHGDVSTIPAAKMGSGSPTNATFLRGDRTWATPTGLAATLTQAQQIGLVRFQARQPTFAYRAPRDFIRTFVVNVDGPELLTGDIWIQRFAGGQTLPGRIKWTSTTNTIDFPSTMAAVDSVLTNAEYPLEIWFYDAASGGSVVETVRINVGLVEVPKAVALTSANDIIFDVDNSTHGVFSAATLTLAHSGDASAGQTGAQFTIMGGRDGSTSLVQITQGNRPGGGWPIQLKDVELFGGVSAPVLKTDNGAVDLLQFHRIGSTWYYTGPYGTGSGITSSQIARLLPELPAEGSRDNKVPKFSGDTLGWEEDATGGGSTAIADNSIVPAKAQANTTVQKAGWRNRVASSQISTGNTLPALSEVNPGDIRIMPTSVSSGLSFVDISDQTTTLTAADAGDIMLVMMFRAKTWVRVGNLIYRPLITENPDRPIVPNAANADKVLYRGKRLYKNIHQFATDPTTTYRNFATSDLPNGYTWGGAVQVSPSPATQANNTIIYSIPGGHFERKVTLGGRAYWGGYNPANWIGAYADESQADQHVSAVGDVVFYGGNVRVVTAHRPGTPDAFKWEPMEPRRFETRVGASPATLPEGTQEISVKVTASNNHIFMERIPVSQISATDEEYQTQNNRSVNAVFRVRYTPATRLLTYTYGSNGETGSIVAIGER